MRRFLILNVSASTALLALILWGPGALPFVEDDTRMTWMIAAAIAVGLWQAWRGRWSTVHWIENKLVFLGLLGTVIGLMIGFAAVNPATIQNVESIPQTVAALLGGMKTALHTTVVGAVGYLWLNVNRRLLG